LVDLRRDEEAFGTAADTKAGVSHPEVINASYEPAGGGFAPRDAAPAVRQQRQPTQMRQRRLIKPAS